jgi:Domain of unknown function (DUF4266)
MNLFKKITWRVLILTLFCMMSGCQTVNAWERGNLAKPQMALEVDPLTSALSSHTFSSKEAASGGYGVGGGGCGCN